MTAGVGAVAIGLGSFCGLLATVASGQRSRLSSHELVKASTLSPIEWRQYRREHGSWYERWCRPLVMLWAHRLRLRPVHVDRLFITRSGLDPDRFTGLDLRALKVIGALSGGLLAVALLPLAPGVLLVAPLFVWAGYIAPTRYLARRVHRRQRQALEELPDVIGMLRAFVIAGVPLERALHLIASQDQFQTDQPILAGEVRWALAQYGLGISIEDALHEMAERVGVDDVRLVVGALAQGRRLGVRLEQLLRDQELMARMTQRNRAGAEASKVGTKLLGVLAGIYLPEFVVLIVIPLFWGIMRRAFG